MICPSGGVENLQDWYVQVVGWRTGKDDMSKWWGEELVSISGRVENW